MIVLDDVGVELTGTVVLKAITARVETGGWLGLIGPNGAGKTTLLRAIAGLVSYHGSVELFGGSQIGRIRDRARLVAYVPQRPHLPESMSVFDYVLLGRTPHISLFGVESRRDRAVTRQVVTRLGLQRFSNRTLGQLSGGESQRVVLARALAQDAPILLLDEPTTALDLGHQQKVLELADELRKERGLTIVCAMHDLTVAGQYADQLVLLVDGRSVLSGPPVEVLTEPNLTRYFSAFVQVLEDGDGGLVVAPRRSKYEAIAEPITSRMR